MKNDILKRASRFLKKHTFESRLHRTVSMMAVLVVACTVAALAIPGITQEAEPICGLEEHVHSVEQGCYELPENVHVHTEECYGEEIVTLVCDLEETEGHDHLASGCERVLICGLEETEHHVHDESCYDEEGNLVCGLEETEHHVHDESCYGPVLELTCGMEETEGHVHDESCYDEEGVLVCDLEEAEGHVHDESCYGPALELTCGLEETEGHIHDDSCYAYTCGLEETEAHTHSEACYETRREVVCGQEEVLPILVCGQEEHTHSEDCYTRPEESDDEGYLCGKEEHVHTSECYGSSDTLPGIEGETLICGKVEHIHDLTCKYGDPKCGLDEHVHDERKCYDRDGHLICNIRVHTHTEECYVEPEEPGDEGYLCGKEEHVHSAEAGCYDENGELICEKEEHTHTIECGIPENEGINSWASFKANTAKKDVTYQLTQNITANSVCTVTGDITIDLNGHKITAQGINWDHIITVKDGGSLTIIDSGTSGTFTVAAKNTPHSLVKVEAGGRLTMDGGTLENSLGFHAIQVNGGTVVINGGTIRNSGVSTNTGGAIHVQDGGDLTINGGTITGNESENGGAIYFTGAGNFTMTGGTISGNEANRGGGLYFTSCTGEIGFSGGTVQSNTAGFSGGGIYVEKSNNVSISGKILIDGNKAVSGGGIRTEDSVVTMSEGTISNNTADNKGGNNDNGANGIGGGICSYQSIITISGGTIENNTAVNGGGGIALRKGSGKAGTENHVTLSGGTIEGNYVTGNEWQYGGGVYLQDYSKFTMESGLIRGNHSKGTGGGIGTDYSGADGSCTGDIHIMIHGGEISGNYSTQHEGGGIGVSNGDIIIQAKDPYGVGNPILIENNQSQTTEHWGGGGIFISDKASGVIIGALIEGNSAGGFGGGLGACSTGHMFYGNGENDTPLAAIFGNTAQGTNLSGTQSKKNADHNAYKDKVFMNSGYQDVYSALEAVISGFMLGNGDEAWVGSADGAPVSAGRDGFVSASQMLGLTSNATAADREQARAAASVYITDNHSNTHGGGIMCNGKLAFGWNGHMDITPGLEIKGTKQYEVGSERVDSVPEFRFVLSNEMPTWEDDHWQAKPDSGLLYTTNDGTGAFDFDLTFGTVQPCLTKTLGTQIFYFWEAAEDGEAMAYDSALYRVTVEISEEEATKTIASAAFKIFYWNVDVVSVERYAPDTAVYTQVSYKQEEEANHNSSEQMETKISRTIVTLEETAFVNRYSGDAKLKIRKVDDNGKPLENAVFTLYKKVSETFEESTWESTGAWQNVGAYTSDGNGIIYTDSDVDTENLAVGVYRLVETAAPENYELLPGYIEFEIKGTGNQRMLLCPFDPAFSDYVEVMDNGLTIQIRNTQAKSSLRIIKVDSFSTERGLQGAEFELWSTGPGENDSLTRVQKLWTATSDEDGLLQWTRADDSSKNVTDLTLTVATYYLYETKAPDGYLLLEEPVIVEVAVDGTVTCTSGETTLQTKDGETVITFLLPNSIGYTLPETGGPGTWGYTLTGTLLIAGVLLEFFRKRKGGEVR